MTVLATGMEAAVTGTSSPAGRIMVRETTVSARAAALVRFGFWTGTSWRAVSFTGRS